jgi:Helix-turn-helix of DDE superfamily endonuclease
MRVPTTEFSRPGEPLRTQRTTGLTVEQFAELCQLVFARIQYWSTGIGRPRSLTLGEAVKATVMYEKNNIAEEVLGELFGVSQPTISRAITKIEPIIADVLAESALHPEDALTASLSWSTARSPPAGAGPMPQTCDRVSTRPPGTTTRSEPPSRAACCSSPTPFPERLTTFAPSEKTDWASAATAPTESATKATWAAACSRRSANLPVGSFCPGRKNSIRRSTHFEPRWNEQLRTSRYGGSCTPTTGDR